MEGREKERGRKNERDVGGIEKERGRKTDRQTDKERQRKKKTLLRNHFILLR